MRRACSLRSFVPALLLTFPGPVFAHLGTPFGDLIAALQDAEVVALVEAVDETRDTADGARTEVRPLAVWSGRLPKRLTIVQPPPHIHRHRTGDVFVVPLGRPVSGAYPCRLESATPLTVKPGEGEALGRLVGGWRALPRPTPSGVRVAHVLQALESSGRTGLGRRIALEVMVGQVDEVRARLDTPARRAIASVVVDAGQAEAYRLGLVRAAALLGDGDVLRALCADLPRQQSLTVRSATLDALAVTGGTCFRTAIDRCRADPLDPLQRRCETLRARLD
jgi:hypothetical protein